VLLEVRDLRVSFRQGRRKILAVDGVSFDVLVGETVGLVGESGSGKSTIANAVLGLVPVESGDISFLGKNVTHLTFRQQREFYRGAQIVFQDPYSSLNPARTVGQTLAEPAQALGKHDREYVRERVDAMLRRVGLPVETAKSYPKSLSGGQRQRIAIARALMPAPKLVICDEATSALDLSIQAQILNLLQDLQESEGLSFLFVSHDLEVVRHMCDRIIVLYAGEVMESGLADDVFTNAAHPYTDALHRAALDPDPRVQRSRREKMDGATQTQAEYDSVGGNRCPFAARCLYSQQRCWEERPPVRPTNRPSGEVACVRYPEWQGIVLDSRGNLERSIPATNDRRGVEGERLTFQRRESHQGKNVD
jgi:oligopeptide/dipeptide ABC transporter ATP-binding protein